MSTTGAPLNLVLISDSDRTPHSTVNANMETLNDLLGGVGAIAWTSYAPTWTNLTVGNGTVVGKYYKFGSVVFCRVSIVFGTTTAVSGDIQFALPVTRATYAGTTGLTLHGLCRALDVSLSGVYDGVVNNTSTTSAGIQFLDASAAAVKRLIASSTVPFTWATGDEIAASFYFEAA